MRKFIASVFWWFTEIINSIIWLPFIPIILIVCCISTGTRNQVHNYILTGEIKESNE